MKKKYRIDPIARLFERLYQKGNMKDPQGPVPHTRMKTTNGGNIMAINFRVSRQRSSNVLNLKLKGDFDGSSAKELINILEDSITRVNRIIIHTNGLGKIHPFGKGVFQHDFPKINRSPVPVIFQGDKGDLLH